MAKAKTKKPTTARDAAAIEPMPEIESIDVEDIGDIETIEVDSLGDEREQLDDDDGDEFDQELAEELTEVQSEFRARAKREDTRFWDAVDSEYWVAFVFQTRAQKEEFLTKLKLISLGDKYVDGLKVAGRLGIKIESPSPEWRESKVNKRLREFT